MYALMSHFTKSCACLHDGSNDGPGVETYSSQWQALVLHSVPILLLFVCIIVIRDMYVRVTKGSHASTFSAGGVDGYRHETTLFRTPFCKRRKAGLWPWEQGKGYGAVDGTYLPSGPRSGCGDYPGDSLSLLQVPFDVLEARHEA